MRSDGSPGYLRTARVGTRPRRLPLFSVILLAVLATSIPLKAWTISTAHGAPGTDLAPELAGMLRAEGFDVRFEHELLGYPAVIGVAGQCRIWLGGVAPDGWHRDVVVSHATDRLAPAFFFAGRAYDDQPAWSTWLQDKTHWLAGALVGSTRPEPVVAALIDRGCAIDRSRWADRLGRL